MELNHRHLHNCIILPNRYVMLKRLPKKAIVAEVGVLGGDFSQYILDICKPKELHLIDTFQSNDWNTLKRFKQKKHHQFIKSKFENEIEDNQIELHKGVSWEKLAEFEDNYFDWIYIDADHKYEAVKNDLEIAYQKVKNDGLLVLNDYILYDHLAKEEYGVIQAVNEFCVKNNWKLAIFALHPQMFCDVVLKKISD